MPLSQLGSAGAGPRPQTGLALAARLGQEVKPAGPRSRMGLPLKPVIKPGGPGPRVAWVRAEAGWARTQKLAQKENIRLAVALEAAGPGLS